MNLNQKTKSLNKPRRKKYTTSPITNTEDNNNNTSNINHDNNSIESIYSFNRVHIRNFSKARSDLIEYPASSLDSKSIKLTNNPLDDYQRSFFSYTLLDNKELDLDIEYTTYKTSIAEQFITPIYRNKQRTNKRHRKYQGNLRRSKHLLECFEYQLPNIRRAVQDDSSDNIGSNDGRTLEENEIETIRKNLCLDTAKNQLLDGVIVDNNDDTCHTNTSDKDKSSTKENPKDISNPINKAPDMVESSIAGIGYSLTKNQKFKLQKMDHNSESNQKTINPNNCIIWTFEGGYVFLTGIWRLYQDVMRGLITMPRKDNTNNNVLQKKCADEFDCTLSHTVFSSDSNNNNVNYSKKRQYHQPNDMRISGVGNEENKSTGDNTTNNESSNITQSKINYTDLHWNTLPHSLRNELFEDFKDYLVKEKHVPQQFFDGYDMRKLIHRIRGGYIKIQGTWIPMEIAKLLCIRFCFPIRYFLVPVFGKEFPEKCEQWYMNNQSRLDHVMFDSNSLTNNFNVIASNSEDKRRISEPQHLGSNSTEYNRQLRQPEIYSNKTRMGLVTKRSPYSSFNDVDKINDIKDGFGKFPNRVNVVPMNNISNSPHLYNSQNIFVDYDQVRNNVDKPSLPHIYSLINSIHHRQNSDAYSEDNRNLSSDALIDKKMAMTPVHVDNRMELNQPQAYQIQAPYPRLVNLPHPPPNFISQPTSMYQINNRANVNYSGNVYQVPSVEYYHRLNSQRDNPNISFANNLYPSHNIPIHTNQQMVQGPNQPLLHHSYADMDPQRALMQGQRNQIPPQYQRIDNNANQFQYSNSQNNAVLHGGVPASQLRPSFIPTQTIPISSTSPGHPLNANNYVSQNINNNNNFENNSTEAAHLGKQNDPSNQYWYDRSYQ